MTVRAVIFDVYGTLLQVRPVPCSSVVEARWEALCSPYASAESALSWSQFLQLCDAAIRRQHEEATARGVAYPEVNWAEITREVLPGLRRVDSPALEAFHLEVSALSRQVELAPGVRAVLRRLQEAGVPVGIASNAQRYSQLELSRALEAVGASLDGFAVDLCFWSFEHGFSKPNPHVFQSLNARLGLRGIHPSEVLMVGDRIDNDVRPALAAGWQAWHWRDEPVADGAALLTRLTSSISRNAP